MFPKTCIRNKILGVIVFIVIANVVGIYLICYTLENNVISESTYSKTPFTYDYFMGMELTGDIRNSFLFNRDYPVIVKDSDITYSIQLIRRLHHRLIYLFIITGALGIFIAALIAKSISRPILKIANSYKKRLSPDEIINDLQISGCKELNLLAQSFVKLQKDLIEQEEERSRRESVEITKTLAAAIAHEIKNPINTIGLTVDYIETNLSPNDPKKRYEFYKLFENVKMEISRLNKIVEGFLRLTVQDELIFKEVNINDVIKKVAGDLEGELAKNNVSLILALDNPISTILADEDKLGLVFSNLIINAIEALPRGGEIIISTKRLDERRIKVDVRDNGVGISKENINKIFKPYYTTKRQGFGLGLPLIQNIIQKHNGKLTVESEKGRGTTFSLYLPVYDGVNKV